MRELNAFRFRCRQSVYYQHSTLSQWNVLIKIEIPMCVCVRVCVSVTITCLIDPSQSCV